MLANDYNAFIFLQVADHLAKMFFILDHHCGLDNVKNTNEAWAAELYFALARHVVGESDAAPDKTGRQFESRFPFSWFIVKRLDSLVNIIADNRENPLSLATMFEQNEMSRPLNENCSGNVKALKAFAHDLLLLKKKKAVKSQIVVDKITEKLLYLARENQHKCTSGQEADLHENRDEQKMITIVSLFEAFKANEKRLDIFLDALEIMSAKDAFVDKLVANDQEHKEELYFDLAAIQHCLEESKPGSDITLEGFKAWQANVVQLGHLVAKVQGSVLSATGNHEDLAVIDLQWQRVKVVKLFMDRVWNQNENSEEIRKIVASPVALLWRYLKDEQMNKDNGGLFEKILKIIRLTSTNVAKKIFNVKNADACIICTEDFKQPVALPCGHVGCRDCFRRLFHGAPEDEDKACPESGCPDRVIPKDFRFKTTKESKDAVMKHASFRKGLSVFLLELLQTYVFPTDGGQPHSDVCRQLMGFVVHGKLEKTKRIGPFGDHIDPNPVVRSFVLQLLLQAEFDKGLEELDKIVVPAFKKYSSDSSYHRELTHLLLNCLEDRLLMKSEKNGDFLSNSMAIKWIREALGGLDDGLETMASASALLDMAKLRLILQTVGNAVVAKTKETNNNNDEKGNEIEHKLIHEAIKLVDDMARLYGDEAAEAMKKYLVRVVYNSSGAECIFAWKRKPVLNGLLPIEIKMTANEDELQDFFMTVEDVGTKDMPYRRMRNALRKAILFGDLDDLKNLALTTKNVKNSNALWEMAAAFVLNTIECPAGKIDEFVSDLDIQEVVAALKKAKGKAPKGPVQALLAQMKACLQDDNPWSRLLRTLTTGRSGLVFLPSMPHVRPHI